MVVTSVGEKRRRQTHEQTPEMRRLRVLLAEGGVRSRNLARALPAGLTYSQVRGMLMGIYGHPVTEAKRVALCAGLSDVLGYPVAESEIWGEETVSSGGDG